MFHFSHKVEHRAPYMHAVMELASAPYVHLCNEQKPKVTMISKIYVP